MAHPYGDSSTLNKFIGTDWVNSFTDLDSSTTASDVQTEAREDADTEIDALLDDTYSVPFNSINASTKTPRVIQTISNMLTVAYLAEKRHAENIDANHFRDLAYKYIDELKQAKRRIPGVSRKTSKGASRTLFYNAGDSKPTFAGYNPDNNDIDRADDW